MKRTENGQKKKEKINKKAKQKEKNSKHYNFSLKFLIVKNNINMIYKIKFN